MGIVAIPFSFTTGTTITASEVNSDFTTIYNEFNGNIDDTNIKAGANINGSKLLDASITGAKLANTLVTDAKMDYTSVKVMRVGPTFIGSNGGRMARGRKTFTYVAGVVSITINFNAADSDDGDPAFSATPRLILTIEHTSGTDTHRDRVTAISSASATVEIRSSNVGDVSSGAVHWMAFGAD